MVIDILTLFPKMFEGVFGESIVRRAIDKQILDLRITDLRSFATDKYKSVDDRPYGGGPGMVMRIDIVDIAVSKLRGEKSRIVLLDAGGKKFGQKRAGELAKEEHIILICGHYEGVDHRVHEHIADEVISIGDYVLSGGEIPAMVVVDSVVRLLPGVLGNQESLKEESFHLLGGTGGTEYPQYTRPEEYKGWKVPDVLLSGNHKKIISYRSTRRGI